MIRRTVFSWLLAVFMAGPGVWAQDVSLTLYPDRVLNRIDEKVYGHFLEHIYHSCNGGLWGDLIWDRSFEGGGTGVVWQRQDGLIEQRGGASDVRLVFGEPGWTDYEFIVEARKTGGREGFLVLLRALNQQEFYWANLGGWGNVGHALERGIRGQDRWGSVTARRNGRIEKDRWYHLRGRCEGPRIQVWLDGERVIDYTDDGRGPRRGRAGVGTWSTQAQFRNFKVTSLEGKILYDELPPLPAVEESQIPGWRPIGSTQVSTTSQNPLNGALCKRITQDAGFGGIAQRPLRVHAGETYCGSLWACGTAPDGLVVQLRDGDRILDRQKLPAPSGSWQEYAIQLKPAASSNTATLQIGVEGRAAFALDQVSLMPESWRRAGGFRPDLLGAIADLKPPVIRWPGGCFASSYRWKDGIGPQHRRGPHPTTLWDDKEVNAFGTDEFIAMCRRVGAEPLIVVNIGTPQWNREVLDNDFMQEVLDWIEYCNGPADSKWGRVRAANGHPEPYDVKYWEIDNETWHMGAEPYAEWVNRFAPAMRRADPSIKLAACGSAGHGDGGNGLAWNRVLIEQCADKIDYLSIHHYASPNRFAEDPLEYEAFFRKTGDLIAASRNPDLKLYVSEWNAQSTDWRTGLYCGGLLNAFERCGDFLEIGGPALFLRHVSASGWDNAFVNFDRRSWFPAPNYVVMKLWRDHYSPTRIDLKGDTAGLNLLATRAEDGRTITIKAVNPTDRAVHVKADVSGSGIRSASMRIIAPGRLQARNTLDAPDAVTSEPGDVVTEGHAVRFTLPPLACGVVKIHPTKAFTESVAAAPASVKTPMSPSLPGAHADPHIACFDGTYYIYPTTDGFKNWGSSSFSCWSSDDLVHWKDRGVILDFKQDLKWADSRAWAPCIARKNGTYFFYFSAEQQIGVAVSDKPTGPFRDPLGKPLVARGSYRCQVIDPMVFIDDDGAAFLYFGQGNCNVVKLNEDMISFDPCQVRRITPEGYNEGAFLLKRHGLYYLMWSSYDTRDPRYCVNYAVGSSPLGPFTPHKNNPILKQQGIVKAAGHHSVVQVPGEDTWYIAYHRFQIPGGNGFNREVCISPMRFDTEGGIQSVDVFEPAYAYFMAYFGPEEKLFYAVSTDARNWKALNGGEPVWSPPFVRDPFINRANGTFHLVHTTGWTGTTIGHWESDDLIHWQGGPVEVVGQAQQKCWAPEFIFSREEGLFYVYWASMHAGSHHAMHYLKTRDWKDIRVSDSALYYDIGIHDIDLTIVEHEGTYYGFHKPGGVADEMGNRLSTVRSLDPAVDSFAGDGHGKVVFTGQIKPTEGPEVIKLVGQEKWYVYGDPFNSALQAWETSDFVTFRQIVVTTPKGAKHCSMLPITRREMEKIRARYPDRDEASLTDVLNQGNPSANQLYIGKSRYDDAALGGRLHDVRFYSTTLSDRQVAVIRLNAVSDEALGVTSPPAALHEDSPGETASVPIYAGLTEVMDIAAETVVGHLPRLPVTLAGVYAEGMTGPRVRVIWPAPTDNRQVQQVGTYVMHGTVPGTGFTPKATVTVKAGVGKESRPRMDLVPFPLGQVVLNQDDLGRDTPFIKNRDKFHQALAQTDPNRFLYNFRDAFGQAQPGGVDPLRGWDSQTTRLRGHASGHYLTAMAQAHAGTTYDPDLHAIFLDKMNTMIDVLYDLSAKSGRPAEPGGPHNADPTRVPPGPGKTDYDSDLSREGIRTDYWNWGEGFISGYPPDQFIMLEQGATYGGRNHQIWAPYYTLHKIMAGLMDCYEVGGNPKALDIARGMGTWVFKRLKALPTETRIKMWNRYIAGEYGGMNEALARLHQLTGDERFLACARLFDNIDFFFGNAGHDHGLACNVDTLRGKHANQHIPQITGALETYRGARDMRYYRVADNFWHLCTHGYMYSIGGVAGARNPNNAECFTAQPDTLFANGFSEGGQNETCATYNLLKLSRRLFLFDPDAKFMDYYEQALYNHILASVAEDNPGNTYHVPLNPGARKRFGNARMDGFTCCNGTALESHTKLQDSIYFKSRDNQALYVNLYVPSTLTWPQRRLQLRQQTRFPYADTTQLTLTGKGTFDLRLRVPGWAVNGFRVKINGQDQDVNASPGTYLTLRRAWRDGDTIELKMPFGFHLRRLMDQPHIASLFYGPVLLAVEEPESRTTWRKVTFNGADLGRSITGDPGTLRFSTHGVKLRPFYETYGRYSVYLDVTLD